MTDQKISRKRGAPAAGSSFSSSNAMDEGEDHAGFECKGCKTFNLAANESCTGCGDRAGAATAWKCSECAAVNILSDSNCTICTASKSKRNKIDNSAGDRKDAKMSTEEIDKVFPAPGSKLGIYE